MQTTITLDSHFHAGPIDRGIFSGFAEHLGRHIYGGIFDPGNPLSDARGFRKDVLELLRPIQMPLVRYPGGNFVSCYNWRDGVGPWHERKARPDYAWQSIEPNTFGTDEFMAWAEALGTRPMMAVNLGTAGTKEAMELLEYCNLPTGTRFADERAANGHKQPYGVTHWCLGNEMDGPWQAGHVPASVYAQRAQQAAKVMKGIDRTIKLIAAGSSNRWMSTYMDWDRQVLEYCWEEIDYISAHKYSGNYDGDSDAYLAEGVEIERTVEDYRGLLGFVRGIKRANKHVFLSFDEWNVWYRARGSDGEWKIAPPLLEEQYNFEDALIAAQFLMSFIRNADIVKLACIAQLVNVIGPLLTRPDGVLVQSIYYPFLFLSQQMKGVALRAVIDAPTYKAGKRGDAPAVDVASSFDESSGNACIALVNRDRSKTQKVTIRFDDRVIKDAVESSVLHHADLKATNTWEKPGEVKPRKIGVRVSGGTATVNLPGPSLVIFTLKTAPR